MVSALSITLDSARSSKTPASLWVSWDFVTGKGKNGTGSSGLCMDKTDMFVWFEGRGGRKQGPCISGGATVREQKFSGFILLL